jgi:hypothetical protein
MSKLTRRFKNNKKNKTIRRGGGLEGDGFGFKERQGVIDVLGNAAKKVASAATTMAADTALNFAGLERKKTPSGEQETEDTSNSPNYDPSIYSNRGKIDLSGNEGDEKQGLLCKVLDVVDRSGGLIISDINEVLASDEFKRTTEEAAKQTAQLLRESSQRFNETLDDPDVKAKLEEAIKKAGEIGEMVVKYGEKPYYQAVDIAGRAARKASSAAASGSIKVGADALSAVPFLGSVVSVGNMINDGSKAASALVEAGSEVVQSASDVFLEVKKNIEKDYKLDDLEERKKLGQQIYNRVNKSISNFQNPFAKKTIGGYKTRRRIFNYNGKSKRVRFAS